MRKWIWAIGLLYLIILFGINFIPYENELFDRNIQGVRVSVSSGEVQVNAVDGTHSLKSGDELSASADGKVTTNESSTSDQVAVHSSVHSATVDVLSASSTIASVTKLEYWFAGYTMDEAGIPLAETTITAYDVTHRREQRKGFVQERKEVAHTQSDANGYFLMDLLKEGRYLVQAVPKLETLSIEEAKIIFNATETAITHNFTHYSAGAIVQGKVVDKETQKSIVGAKVSLDVDFSSKDWKAMLEWTMPFSVTGEDGVFTIRRIRPGSYTLEAIAKGYEFYSSKPWIKSDPLSGLHINQDTVKKDILIQLTKGGSVIVRVFDPQGNRLSNAIVEVIMQGLDVSSETIGRTDEKGEWRTDSIKKGKGVAQSKHDLYGHSVSEVFTAGTVEQPAIADVHLTEFSSVSGRVTLKDGKPAVGHVVFAFSDMAKDKIGDNGAYHYESVDTDSNGNYAFDNLGAGPYVIRTNKKKEGGYSYDDPAARKFITLEPGEKRTGVDLVMEGTSDNNEVVRGKVVDQNGLPVKDILVMIHIFDSSIPEGTPGKGGTTHTNESGEFEVTGLVKVHKFTLTIWAQGFEKYGKIYPMDGEYLTITLIGGGGIAGYVIGKEDQQPIAGAEITLYSMVDLNFNVVTALSGEDGRFEFPTQAPGIYRMLAREKGHSTREISDIRVEAGKKTDNFRIEMESGMKLLGQVLSPNGQPVANVSAVLLSQGTKGRKSFINPQISAALEGMTVTDANGIFEVILDPQSPDLLVLKPKEGFSPQLVPVNVSMIRPEPVPFRLTNGAIVEGKVYDAKGNVKSNSQIYLFDNPDMNFIYETLTDEQGEYRIEHLPATNMTVMKMGGNEPLDREYKIAKLQEGKTVQVNFGSDEGATVQGIVTDQGQPVENIAIVLTGMLERQFQLNTRTDAIGHYLLRGVPEGEYQLLASRPTNREPNDLYSADTFQQVQITSDRNEYDVNLDISTIEVVGIVKDAVSGNPVGGVEVQPDYQNLPKDEATISRYPRPGTTDNAGIFKTRLKAPGTYPMVATKAGYDLKPFDIRYETNAQARVMLEVLMQPSETILEAHLFYNGQPVMKEYVVFQSQNLKMAFPSEPIPDTPGAYRVYGLPEGTLDLYVMAADMNGGVELRERLESVTIQKGPSNRLMINLTPFVNYALSLKNQEGFLIPLTEKSINVQLPDTPRFAPPTYGNPYLGGISYLSVPIPVGPNRMRLQVDGYKPIECVPLEISKPITVSYRLLEIQLEKQ